MKDCLGEMSLGGFGYDLEEAGGNFLTRILVSYAKITLEISCLQQAAPQNFLFSFCSSSVSPKDETLNLLQP